MKYFLLFMTVLTAHFSIHAQQLDTSYTYNGYDFEHIDSLDGPYDVMMDSVFAQLNLAGVTTGYLLDKGFTFCPDPLKYDGSLTDSNNVRFSDFMAVYGTIFTSDLDTAIREFPTPDTIYTIIDNYMAEGKTPIMLMDWSFHRIKPTALQENLLQVQGMQLIDVPGRPTSPYELKRIISASPGYGSSLDSEFSFVLPPEFLLPGLWHTDQNQNQQPSPRSVAHRPKPQPR